MTKNIEPVVGELVEILSSTDRRVTMSNALVRAGHGLTLAEKRIVMIAISKLDSRKNPPNDVILATKITAAEYAETCSVSMNTAYDQLKDASANLNKRSVIIFTPAHKRGSKDLTGTIISDMHWVGQVDYAPGDGWVKLYWWPNIIKHLMGLKRHFTSYHLQQGTALRSVHSWRLAELLLRFKKYGWAQYSIEDFAQSMDATEKQKKDFAQMRRRIIEPAVLELQEKHNWKITWKTNLNGRKVKSIRFDFSRDDGFAGVDVEE